jgi:hypothetical protein
MKALVTSLWLSAAVSAAALAQTSVQTLDARSDPTLVPTPSDIAPGKLLQSPDGSRIGTVENVIPDAASGRTTYVLVTSDSGVTPIPYAAMSHLLRDAHIVIDKSIFESAPRFSEAQIGSGAGDTWKRAADQYWHVYR